MDIIDVRTASTVVVAILFHSITSRIPDTPQELYFFPYVIINAAFVSYLLMYSDGAIWTPLTTANAIFFFTAIFLTITRRLYISPLAKFPGPKAAAVTALWNANEARLGRIPRTYKALHEKYKSDVIRVGPNEVSIRNTDAISRIYKGRHPRGNFNQVFNLVGGDTIATVRDYDRHSIWRRVWDRSLKQTELPKYMERVKGHVDRTVEILHEKAGEPVESNRLFDALIFDVLTDLTFSKDVELQHRINEPTFVDLLHNFVRFAGVVGHLPALQQIYRYLPTSADGRKVNQFANEMIAERRAVEPEDKDFFARFSTSEVFSKEELKLQALTVITAGADTVSKALNQMFGLLASRPDIQDRIRQELNDAYSGKGVPSTEVLRSLKYLDGVIKESLRMFPPLFRGAPAMAPKGGVKLETGDFIPQDTQIWISQYLVMSDERNFPRAAEFLPERWMSEENGDENELVKDRRAWFPFGNGAHSCPGKGFAMEEIRFIVTYLLKEFDVRFEDKDGKPFNYREWADNWKDLFAVEMDDLYLKFIPRAVAGVGK
ncbi:cytochrome P450 [Colletotrichum sublineola]|nr:cytochrome P450 [Colletotrichum sublineola]